MRSSFGKKIEKHSGLTKQKLMTLTTRKKNMATIKDHTLCYAHIHESVVEN